METVSQYDSEKIVLERLNQEYVNAFMNADVDWYRKHLAEQFVCIESDGSVLTKQEFLSNAANGPDVVDYNLESVDVSIYGEAALVRATGLWHRKDGTIGLSRYIDVWVKQNGDWKTVSAQITRTAHRPARGRYKQ
jgi:ketosteroid isomerase-like protein